MSGEDWRHRARCRGVDPDTMQPEVATAEQVGDALELCGWCPVRAECLALAESQQGAYGVHGGQWFGEPPARPADRCAWCGEEVSAGATYCRTSSRCRTAAARARASLVPVSA